MLRLLNRSGKCHTGEEGQRHEDPGAGDVGLRRGSVDRGKLSVPPEAGKGECGWWLEVEGPKE